MWICPEIGDIYSFSSICSFDEYSYLASIIGEWDKFRKYVKLSVSTLVPNRVIHNIINAWCKKHRIHLLEGSNTNATTFGESWRWFPKYATKNLIHINIGWSERNCANWQKTRLQSRKSLLNQMLPWNIYWLFSVKSVTSIMTWMRTSLQQSPFCLNDDNIV